MIDYNALVARTGSGTLDTNAARTVVSADAVRRMACDCDIHRLITGPQSTILDHGRSQRVVTDTLFDVLALRDGGCRINGCVTPAGGCDAHHAVHWADQGVTEPDNLALVCWHHHHWLHEQHWRLQPHGAGHFTLIDPHGAEHPVRPPWLGHAPPPNAPPPDATALKLGDAPSDADPARTLFDPPPGADPAYTLFDTSPDADPARTLFDPPV